MTAVIVLVAAYEAESSIAATVTTLRSVVGVTRVLVVDDGSSDRTATAANEAGAEVLSLPRNLGKGGAVAAGVAASPDADVFLLVDADIGVTASHAGRLLGPVVDGDLDLTIGVLPSAGTRGGFGSVVRVARGGIRRATGLEVRSPLSGQRAVRADLLRGSPGAPRFGIETAMTIDAHRAGARIAELEVPMDHEHTGRGIRGFAHRGRQGVDVLRALWPRLVGDAGRMLFIAGLALLLVLALLASASASVPPHTENRATADRVVIVGIPRWGLGDLDAGISPTIDALSETGATAAMSVRTLSGRPATAEAYASLGAGARVRTAGDVDVVVHGDDAYEGTSAAEAVARRTGVEPLGSIVAVGSPSILLEDDENQSSGPGALGDALRAAGLRTAAFGASDYVDVDGAPVLRRPAPLALIGRDLSVDEGDVSPELLERNEAAPFGIRADVSEVLRRFDDTEADVVVVDPGDMSRAGLQTSTAVSGAGEAARRDSLRATDAVVAGVLDRVDERTLVLVVGLTPPTREWELTPIIATGPGIEPGYLSSPATKRRGLVTLTDVAPTILTALDIPVPDGMIGSALGNDQATVDAGFLRDQNERAGGRETIYFPIALTFIIVQALTYIFAGAVMGAAAPGGRALAVTVHVLRFVVLAFAAWPLATFVLRAIPGVYDLGGGAHILLWAIAAGFAGLAARARAHALAPLAWICGATVGVLLVDVGIGAPLQMSSILGYSPHTAARFTGFGNTAFAVLAASSVVVVASHIDFAPRRRDAMITVSCFAAVVIVADGAPTLGSDVGGIITLVPVFGLTLWVISGRRLSLRVVGLALTATVVALGVAIGVDLLRAEESQSHLGRFVTASGDDSGTFWTTVARKWETNLRVFSRSIWTWMVPIMALFALYVLVVAKGWRRLLPPGTPLRAGLVGILAAGVIGWLVNDSGVVVAALAFVYAGPYLTLLALDRRRGDPLFLPARPGAPAPTGATPAPALR